MPTSSRSDQDAVLKDFYLPGIRTTLNSQVFLLTQAEQNSEDIEGRDAVMTINIGRNQGIGSRTELGNLPDAGAQSYVTEKVRLKYHYGRIQLSGQIIRDTRSDRGSFTRAVQSETTGMVRDLKNDLGRQSYGDGTGLIGVASGAKTGQTFPATGMSRQAFAQLGIGMSIDLGSTSLLSNDIGSGLVITGLARSTSVITVTGTIGIVASGTRISRAGNGMFAGNTVQKELTGARSIVAATGTLFNIDPTANPDWASFVKTSAGVVTEDMFEEVDQEVNLASGEQIDLWVTTALIHRKVSALLTGLKRFPGSTELKGGYTGLDMSTMSQGMSGTNTVSMVYDKDMTETGAAYGFCTKRLTMFSGSDWEFMQEDGAILSRVPNKDAYEATLFAYKELGTDGRAAHGKIEGAT